MRHSLPHLHLTRPLMRRPRLLTVVALMILHNEFNAECLLQERAHLHLLLHGKLKLDSPAVSFCVDKLSV